MERLEKKQGLSLFWAWSLLRSYRGGSRETAARHGSQEHISLNPIDLTLLSALLSLPLDFLSLMARCQPGSGPSLGPLLGGVLETGPTVKALAFEYVSGFSREEGGYLLAAVVDPHGVRFACTEQPLCTLFSQEECSGRLSGQCYPRPAAGAQPRHQHRSHQFLPC